MAVADADGCDQGVSRIPPSVPACIDRTVYRPPGGMLSLARYNPELAGSLWEPNFSFIRERLTALASGKYGVNPEFSADLTVLRLHGLIFDTIVAASPAPPLSYGLDVYSVSAPTPAGFWTGLWGSLLQYYHARELMLKWQSFIESNTDFNSGTTAADPYIDEQGENGMRSVLWRAIIGDRIRGIDGTFTIPDDNFINNIPPLCDGATNPILWQYWKPAFTSQNKAQNTSYRAYIAECSRATTGRSFILTSKGFLGLGPVSSQMGDIVCLVRGCDVPVVLRPVAGKEGVYKMVGDCYVHGIMDGSFARRASRQDVKRLEVI